VRGPAILLPAILCGVSALLVAAVPAAAQRVSSMPAGRFLQICKSGARGQPVCEAYIAGAADSFAEAPVLARNSGGDKFPPVVCIPRQVTGQELRETVVAWLDGHRDQLRQPVGDGVFAALQSAYPCKGAK